MSKTLVVKAKGQGGFVDPASSAYISSKHDSAAPDGPFVRAKIDEGSVELIDTLNLEWDDFLKVVDETETKNDFSAALAKVRQHPSKTKHEVETKNKQEEKDKEDAEAASAKAAAEAQKQNPPAK